MELEKAAMGDETKAGMILRSTELIHRTMMSQAIINSALDLPKVFPEFKENVLQSHMTGETAMKAVVAQIDLRMLKDEVFSTMAKGLADQATVNAETVISAAVIVLAHSTADDVFTGACGIAIDLAPDKWRSELNLEKTIRLGDLQDKGAEGVFASELEKFKVRVGKKSLPSRAELLFRHVPIKKHQDILQDEDSYYRAQKLVEADDLRHTIIHGSGLPSIAITKSRAVAVFLHEAAFTALRSLAFRFDLPLDTEHFQKLSKMK